MLSAPPLLFDRALLRIRRRRAREDFLLREIEARLAERLQEVPESHAHTLWLMPPGMPSRMGEHAIVLDEETLPFAPATLDAVVAAGGLHWVNDLPGALVQLQRALKPGGLFLALFPGGETLRELRHALLEAELEYRGGAAARVSPMLDAREAGALLSRAGLSWPVVDTERLTLDYASPSALIQDLRAMGETNALSARQPLPRRVWEAAVARHPRHEGRIHATVDLVALTAWKA